MAAVDGRRAVGTRNAEAILDAAAAVLGADAAAGMGEVAAAAGVGRATLYRHYPTRDALVAALGARVRARFGVLRETLQSDRGDPAVALARFVEELFVLREGHVAIHPREGPEHEARVREVWHPLVALVRRWQREGAVDAALDPDWVLASLRGQIRAAAIELDAGRLTREELPALVVRGFLRGAGQ